MAAAIILAVALTGLLAINADRAAADAYKSSQDLVRAVEGESNVQPSNQPFFTSSLLSLIRMISALSIVLICIYLALYLLKRIMGKRYSGGGRYNLLEVLGTICVAPKKTVSLIRVADKSVLVGMTDNQISVLTELDTAETAEIVAEHKDNKEKDRFNELLKSASHRIRQMSARKS